MIRIDTRVDSYCGYDVGSFTSPGGYIESYNLDVFSDLILTYVYALNDEFYEEGELYIDTAGGQTINLPTISPYAKGMVAAKYSPPQYTGSCYTGTDVAVGADITTNYDTPLGSIEVRPSVGWVQDATRKVAGLTYNATKHRQEAGFTVAANPLLNNAPLPTGSGYTVVYQWTDPNGNLRFDDPTARTTTAYATGPGYCLPTCTVVLFHNGTAVASGVDSRACAAIGGPISVSVSGNSGSTYNHDGNDPTKPWYLTFYDYSHQASLPRGAEATNDALLRTDNQPDGTTITLDAIPGTYITTPPQIAVLPPPGVYINSVTFSRKVQAEATFTGQVPHVHFHFSYAGLVGDADDDSADTQDPIKDKDGNVTGYQTHIIAISAHMPSKDLVDDPQNPYSYVTNPLMPTGYQNYAQTEVRYQLLDTTLQPMPGVWVQERFIDNNPLNLTTNAATGYYWITDMLSTLDKPDKNGVLVNPGDGYFEWDKLARYWNLNPNVPDTTQHEYFAGTMSSVVGDKGISLGVYKITFTPGNPDRTLSGFSRQDRNP